MATATTSNAEMEPLAYRQREAAKVLGVSPRTLWAWTVAGDVPHVRRGRTILYPRAALERWLASQTQQGGCEDA